MDKRNIDTVLIRMDKIGDLVVTLPVDEHPAFSGQRVHWLITRGLSFVGEQAAPKRAVTEFKRGFGLGGELFRMVRWFKRNNPRTVVLLHNPWWVGFAAWLAGVPERIGRLSQWHSFLFLNIGIRQSRKSGDKHESDFNFDLVEQAFNRLGHRRTPNLSALKRTYLRLLPPNPFGTLESRGLKTKGYRVVHPGMGGSALNWPPEFFCELINRLAQEKPVVITGTKADHKFLAGIKPVQNLPNVKWLVDELKVFELLDLLSQASCVIAPSTGVLHLAASLGAPVVGIYSPRKMEHPRRWGPKGPCVAVHVPPVAETDMIHPDVMREIKSEHVYQSVLNAESGKAPHDSVTFPTA
jgi:ADP-heptose:LPS heptosyltransferase